MAKIMIADLARWGGLLDGGSGLAFQRGLGISTDSQAQYVIQSVICCFLRGTRSSNDLGRCVLADALNIC